MWSCPGAVAPQRDMLQTGTRGKPFVNLLNDSMATNARAISSAALRMSSNENEIALTTISFLVFVGQMKMLVSRLPLYLTFRYANNVIKSFTHKTYVIDTCWQNTSLLYLYLIEAGLQHFLHLL